MNIHDMCTRYTLDFICVYHDPCVLYIYIYLYTYTQLYVCVCICMRISQLYVIQIYIYIYVYIHVHCIYVPIGQTCFFNEPYLTWFLSRAALVGAALSWWKLEGVRHRARKRPLGDHFCRWSDCCDLDLGRSLGQWKIDGKNLWSMGISMVMIHDGIKNC